MKSPASFFLAIAFATVPAACAQSTPQPIQVKVVVVTTFEIGADTGDKPGELQYWVERDHLDRIYPLPAGYHAVRMNGDGEMAIVTGRGGSHAAATIMALGLDPRFDLRHAYWIIAGIAGGCPQRVSLGSAAWARWVVDGDLGYEIDAREIPAGWSTGYVPFDKKTPFEQPVQPRPEQMFALNQGLVDWAFHLTRANSLEDTPQLQAARNDFDGAAAHRPPFVMEGDEISSSTFWHGKLLDAWASRWVPYFTGGKGVYATTAMEDSGALQSLQFLAHAGRVDWRRVMVLRTVSNYDQQPRGLDAAASLATQRVGKYSAYLPALEAAYRVGHAVVNELLTHWQRYETIAPDAHAAPNR